MSIPKEPRQIMINLMYLVLTALLALNVSNEILNAFKTLSGSIDKSNRSIDAQTGQVYEAIKESETEKGQYEKVHQYRLQADDVVKKSDEMVAFFNVWKRRIVMAAGGYGHTAEDSTYPDKMDNIDATTSLLVEQKGGDTIRQKILQLREFLLAQVPKDSSQFSKQMALNVEPAKKTDDNPKADWNRFNFEHMPAIAALALFSKFQNDIRSSENMVIKRLSELAHTKELKFDSIVALAVPKQSYATKGDKIEATILLAAFNKANKPSCSIQQGGGKAGEVKNGVIPWETVAEGTGLQTVKGTLTYESAEQGKKSLPWTFDYMVGTTGASLQLDKMNVFYIGVANPVTVSANGYNAEDISLHLPEGTATPKTDLGLGHYDITVNKPDDNYMVDIMANSKEKGGAPIKVSSMKVRVKLIPDPIALLGKQRDGIMLTNLFKALVAPGAVLEHFEFDAKFQVIEFKFGISPKSGDYIGDYTVKLPTGAAGARFSDNADVARAQRAAKPGDRVVITGIKALGPDRKPRFLNPIIVTLN